MKISIADNKETLLNRGKPFFYLADTVWSVFTEASLEEWEEYLDYRKTQNFNALQISILPLQHDSSGKAADVTPFEADAMGNWDFYRMNASYYDKAAKMLEMAYDRGFLPVLVVLWNNYVPGAWANAGPGSHTIPFDAVQPYTEYIVKSFTRFNPLYFISGDTNLENDQVIAYFMKSLETVKACDPTAITAMHIGSHHHSLPDYLIESKQLELYIYQSGHQLERQEDCYELAAQFLNKPVKRPILNSEPCYEGHGFGYRYGRFTAFDVRKAFWSSLLGGAKAGFTYGAHGIWSWHKKGDLYKNMVFGKTPFDWKIALRFKGAWDVGYAKKLFEQYAMYDVSPRNDLLVEAYPEILLSANDSLSKIVIYVPYSIHVELNIDLSEYQVEMLELDEKLFMVPAIESIGSGSRIEMSDFNSDTLIIAVKH